MTESGGVTPDEPVDDLSAGEPIAVVGDHDSDAAEPAQREEPKNPEEPEIVEGPRRRERRERAERREAQARATASE
jgi:cell division protein FtsQ